MSHLYNDIDEGDKISVGWGNDIEDAIGDGNPAQYASYAIFKDGSDIKARNGLTGKIDHDDTDWVDLMNTVIDDLYDDGSGDGGLIVLTDPFYTATDTIDMRPGIWIRGRGVVGRLGSGQTGAWKLGTTIEATTDITVFSFNYPTATQISYWAGLRRMFLIGPEYASVASTKPAIDIQCDNNYAADIILEEVCPLYWNNGIRIYNNSATYKIWNVHISKCMPEDNNDAGVLIDSPTNGIIERVKIFNSHFYDNCIDTGLGGIEIDGHSTYASYIANNSFEKENIAAIAASDEADTWVIIGNVCYDCDTDAGDAGIFDFNDVDFFAVTGNNIGNKTSDYTAQGIHYDANCTYCATIGNVVRVENGGTPITYGAGAGQIGDNTMNVERAANL